MSEATAYLAADGCLDDLLAELAPAQVETFGRLVVAEGPARPAAWAANTWHEPRRLAIASIGDAAKQLRTMQRNWALYAFEHHRRAALIEAKLPSVKAAPLVFGTPAPTAPLGSFTLLDAATLLAAPRCSSPFRHGEARFVEDKTGPPNRAYLKLWEALTLIGMMPGPGDTCLDLGAAPGGWTHVLANLGATVIAVDKAPLDPAVAGLPNVRVRQQSAFGLDPAKEPPVDWLFCDVICYPSRLLQLVRRWIDAGNARRFVCTVKFQGATDTAAMADFAAIEGSRLMHLFHNKHELTWVKL